jgi:C-terminal processing protease CtpA/Prc
VATPFRYFERIKVTTIHPSFATWKAATFEDLRNGTRPARDGGFLVEPRLHSGVAEQTPAPNPFLGRLFVLIDGGTFSTAADVCAQIRSRTKATFIGEETGGGFEGNTSGLNALIVLPHSGLKLKIHMYGYWNAVAGGQRGRGTLPDIAAVRTVRDVLAGTDPPLDLAIELANDVAGQGGSRPLAVAIGVSF